MKLRSLVVAAVALSASSAIAEPSSAQKALAMRLFDDAEKLMASASYAGACPKYAESQRLDPQLGTLLHLGDCYEKAGKTASAWGAFKDAVEISAARKDAREERARQRLDALENKVPKLSIVVTSGEPEGIEVRQDGEVVSRVAWGTASPVDPGKHAFTAKAPRYKTWSKNVDVPSTGDTVQVTVPQLEPETAEKPSVQTPAAQPGEPVIATPVAARESHTPVLGYVVGGVGVVGLGVGGAFALRAMSKNSESNSAGCVNNACPPDAKQMRLDARSAGNVATVGFVAGGALLAVGVTLILLAPKSTATQVGVAAIVNPNGTAGLSMTGRF
jgi:hypothetical protein